MSSPQASFYSRSTEVVARELVGKNLVRIFKRGSKGFRLVGRIVETEAYGYSDDLASHACNGKTARNSVMFGEVGRAYIYFTYGNHFCVNVSARQRNIDAGAVLIRAIEPTEGIEMMKQLRPVEEGFSITSGPGKLTQALGITCMLNGTDMTNRNSELRIEHGSKPKEVLATTRIGITRSVEKEWRYADPSSPYVSRKIQFRASKPASRPLLHLYK